MQCDQCFKWRVISTQEEFEDIRSTFIEEPFNCSRRSDISCEDPADIEYDATRTWVIDKPNIPKTPEGFKRRLVLRKDYSKLDSYYTTPTGKSMRTINEMTSFLQANPSYQEDVHISNFSFTVPKIMEDTIPEDFVVRKRAASASGYNNKKLTPSKGC